MNINLQTTNYFKTYDPSYIIYGRVRSSYKKKIDIWVSNYIEKDSIDKGILINELFEFFIETNKINSKKFTINSFSRYLKNSLNKKNIPFQTKRIQIKQNNNGRILYTKYFGISLNKNITPTPISENKVKQIDIKTLTFKITYDNVKAWALENIIIDQKFNNFIRTQIILNHYLEAQGLTTTSNLRIKRDFVKILTELSLKENLALKPLTRDYSVIPNIQIKNVPTKPALKIKSQKTPQKKLVNKNIFYATIFTYLSFNIFFFTGLLYLI